MLWAAQFNIVFLAFVCCEPLNSTKFVYSFALHVAGGDAVAIEKT